MGSFWRREPRAGMEYKTEIKPAIFTVIPCNLQWQNHPEPLPRAAAGSCKYPVLFKR